jgi:hypothetical protein
VRAWEPWQPEEGDRVRINVSPECRTFHLGRRGGGMAEALRPQREKRLTNNGQIGVVVKITEPDPDESPSEGWDDFFAACELEPLA